MVEIYGISLKEIIVEEIVGNYISERITFKLKKVKSYYRKKQMIVGDLLIRYLIYIKKGIQPENVMIETNENGKPYIKNVENFYYNISHSGEWLVCAISEEDVGIDLSAIKNFNMLIVKSFFTEPEYAKIKETKEVYRNNIFHVLWTLKECYFKFIGNGLTLPMDYIDFSSKFQDITKEKIMDISGVYFRHILFGDNYSLSVCSADSQIANEVTVLKYDQIVDVMYESDFS